MTIATVKQANSSLEVTKAAKQDIMLDLNKVLAEAWTQGTPCGFLACN